MSDSRWKRAWAGLLCAAGLLGGGTAQGQSLGDPAPPSGGPGLAAPRVGAPVASFPLAMPMIAPSNLNAAASSGMDVGGNPVQGNLFANPYIVPFFAGGMMAPGALGTGTSLSTSSSGASSTATSGAASSGSTAAARAAMGMNQLGLLMMATQNPNGVGSGRLSGVRGGATPSRNQATAQAQTRRSLSNQPGGLAARYFSRNTPRSGIPRNYYNRQSRYFP